MQSRPTIHIPDYIYFLLQLGDAEERTFSPGLACPTGEKATLAAAASELPFVPNNGNKSKTARQLAPSWPCGGVRTAAWHQGQLAQDFRYRKNLSYFDAYIVTMFNSALEKTLIDHS